MDWMLLPLKRYADFQGRSRRMEFWMFALGIAVVEVIYFIIMAALQGSTIGMLLSLIFMVAMLALLVPSISLAFRRMHDQDKSAWFLLIGLIPFVGGLILLVFYCLPGTEGPNQYGPDPKGDGSDVIGGGVMAARPDLR